MTQMAEYVYQFYMHRVNEMKVAMETMQQMYAKTPEDIFKEHQEIDPGAPGQEKKGGELDRGDGEAFRAAPILNEVEDVDTTEMEMKGKSEVNQQEEIADEEMPEDKSN